MSLSEETMATSIPCSTALGECADHVVGFEARGLEDRDTHGFEDLDDPGDLVEEVLRGFCTIRFVVFEDFVAEGLAFAFEDGGDVGGLIGGNQLLHHIVEDVDGFG